MIEKVNSAGRVIKNLLILCILFLLMTLTSSQSAFGQAAAAPNIGTHTVLSPIDSHNKIEFPKTYYREKDRVVLSQVEQLPTKENPNLSIGPGISGTLEAQRFYDFTLFEDFVFQSAFGQAAAAPNIWAHAVLSPIDSYYKIEFPKTYYREKDRVVLWAYFKCIGLWEVPYEGKELSIKYKVTIDGKIIFETTLTRKLTQNDGGLCGWGPVYQFPPKLGYGKSGILEITILLSEANIKNNRSSSRIDLSKEENTDLPASNYYDFAQTSWQWSDAFLGDCTDAKIGRYGCATTSKAYIFNYLSGTKNYNPFVLNKCLTANDGGYTFYEGCHSGCPIDGKNLICAPSDVLWDGCVVLDQSNRKMVYAKIEEYIDEGFPVMVKTSKWGEHFVVVVGKRTSGKLNIYDPLDGQRHMMEKDGITNSMILKAYFFSQY